MCFIKIIFRFIIFPILGIWNKINMCKGGIKMKRITDFIIEKRYFILVSFILFSILSFFMMQQVKINYDIASYLPKTSETRTGLDIMDEEFDELSSSSFNLMFKGLEELEKKDIYQELAKIDGVKSIDYDNTSKYNKDDYTMYVINVDAKEDSVAAKNVFNKVKENYQDYEIYTNGAIASRNTDVLPVWIVFLAIGCAMIILIIMCESYIEPFLFIFSIGMAVFLNKGTNIIFGSVSNITDSIVAILQLALSMDYSIMLMNRYSQEKNTDKNKVSAMKKALYNSFISISSSSITTIVGLLALVFMSFTIGRDLGLVLAKGVLFSLISIFFVLPGLILMFDKWIVKTKKKTLNIKLNKLGNISYKLRYPSLVIIVLALVGSYLLKGNLTILYTNSEADKVADIFPNNNQMAIIYKNEDEDLIANHCKHLEKEDRVVDALCYGNTINDRLTYDKLNNKFEGLGSDVSVDDYLLKIVYYNYYNKDNNSKMTLSDLITFIKSYIYPNSDMNKHVTTDTRKNIERLNNFVVDENINKKRTSKEIANILGIDEGSINDLFIYYNSLYNDNKLTIKEFVDFMNKDILTNKKYAKNIDENTKNSLKTLTKFTNVNIITKQMTSNEMAKLFGVDKQIMADLYSYYLIKNPMSTKLSLNEFANFVVNDVLTDQTLSKTIDNDARENIKLLAKFSDKRIINQKMNSASLSELFNLDKETVDKLMLLYYSQIDDGTTFTLKEFIIEVIKLKLNTDYLDDIDINLEKLEVFMQNKDIFNNDKVSKDTLKKYFDEYLVNKTYSELKIADDIQMTPEEFIDKVLDYLANYVDVETMERLQLIKRAIIDNTQLTSTELSKILNVDAKYIYQLYALINYNNGNTSHFQMTPYELVDLLINNSNKVDSTTLEKLYFVKKIMDSSLDNKIYSSKELASFLDMDKETVNSIYALYNAKDNNIKLSPKIVTSFILKYQDDSLLKHNLSNNMLAKVKLVDEVMSSTLNNKKYSSLELSQLLGVDKETLDLIYSLYNSKDKVIKVSLKEFTDFLLDKVLTNKKYSSRFDNTKKVKLQTINKIMNNSLVNYQYGFRELYDILTKLSDSLDSNLIELVYL